MGNQDEVEIKRSICLWCKGECGVFAKVKDGRLLGIEENPDYPRKVFPRLRGCPRAKRAKEYVYHPDRLRYPRKRVGDRGGGKWEQITWEQALDEIAEKLSRLKGKYGAETLASTTGTYRTHWEFGRRFFNLFGSPNELGQAVICSGPRQIIAYTICGNFSFYAVTPKTKCIVLLGIQLPPARPRTLHDIREARKNGAKLIVIDPRGTGQAPHADIWLQLRHGTDCALLMGMIKVIIDENLYDADFVNKWCYGFDKLRERVKEYPLDRVEEVTHIPAEKIREAARMYATNKPATFIEGMGVEQQQNNAEILHARWILAAITGNLDVEGGEEFRDHHHPDMISSREMELMNMLPAEQKAKQIGYDRFKLFSWKGRQIVQDAMIKTWGKAGATPWTFAHAPSAFRTMLTGEPYPIKALITYQSNPMVTFANTKLIYKAIKNLDLYVVKDFFETPSAALADYVLPSACWLERPALILPHSDQAYMAAGEQALPSFMSGEYDYRTDFDFFRGLGMRLGQEEYWPWSTLEDAYDYQLKPAGYTLKEFVNKVWLYTPPPKFKKYEEKGFGTLTGKVELYSTVFEKLGYDPLPQFREAHETVVSTPELLEEYPFTLLTGGRIAKYYHSEWRQIESLRKEYPHPRMQIHPQTAQELGIKEGDWVWIETLRGRIKQKATLFDKIDPKAVHAEHGWWLPELPGEEPWLHGVWEWNIDVLLDEDPEHCNPILGTWGLKTALCKVYKAKEY